MAVTRMGLSVVLVGALLVPSPAGAQELGHKLLGGLGVTAGLQSEPGLYVLDRLIVYSADQVRDRNGNALPISDLDVDALGNVFGLAFTTKIRKGPFLNVAIGAPLARLSVSADHPLITLEDQGLGDIFVQPIRLGWRFQNVDLVGSYTFYAPTGRFEPRGASVGRGYWTHQFSLGGGIRSDPDWRASILASYDLNGRKRDIDITRGNSVQIQGGAGGTYRRFLHLGIAGFALWQVTDNSGTDLPPAARDARTRVYGLGPEIGVTIPSIRTRLDLRYQWEIGVRSRQDGRIFVASATLAAWTPSRPPIPVPTR